MVAEAALTATAKGLEAVLAHHLDLDHAGPDRVRDRAAAHAREDDAREHVDVREASAKPPHERVGEGVEALAQGAGVHHVCREDEHRHGDQHEAPEEAVQDLLGGKAHILPGRAEIGDSARDHREADRAPQQGDDDEYHQHQPESGAHALSDASGRRIAARQRSTTMTAAARKTQ